MTDRLSVIEKSELTDEIKRSFFFQAAVVSILLYRCTTYTLTKRMEKKLDGNYTRMLWAILNKSWKQQPTKQQLYGRLPPITKTIKVKRTRHTGHCRRRKDELISKYSSGPLPMDEQKQYDRLEPIYNSSVRIQDIALKTPQEQWTIETDGDRGSGRSVLAARHQNDDEEIRSVIDKIYNLYRVKYWRLNFFFFTFCHWIIGTKFWVKMKNEKVIAHK